LIEPFQPKPVNSVLDIGGGMGGFDALLNSLWPGVDVGILDGMRSGPVVGPRDEPYSNADVAEEFLRENGVTNMQFFDPDELPDDPMQFDLIISLQAWCFHFLPSRYMDFALKCSRRGTVWILDVRIMQRFWASDLFSQERLEPIGEAPGFTEKYTRMAFKVIK
jgi:SAM-dependent methyltransferase